MASGTWEGAMTEPPIVSTGRPYRDGQLSVHRARTTLSPRRTAIASPRLAGKVVVIRVISTSSNVNTTSPAGLDLIHPGHAQGPIEHFREPGKQTALGRIGQPDDIAPAVVHLASDDASWVTGETHDIAGGVR